MEWRGWRGPQTRDHALADAVALALLAVRHRHPSWGPRKVKAWLEDRHGERAWPASCRSASRRASRSRTTVTSACISPSSRTPPSRRRPASPCAFDGVLRAPDCPHHAQVRRVRTCGAIRWQGDEFVISEALSGGPVDLFPLADEVWLVKYGPIVLGTIKGRQGFIRIGAGRPSRPDPHQNRTRNL